MPNKTSKFHIMHSDKQIEQSLLKLAKLSQHLGNTAYSENAYSHEQIKNNIVLDNLDLNCKIRVANKPNSIYSTNRYQDSNVLFIAARYHSDKLLSVLLDRGADFTAKNLVGQTILHLEIPECNYYSCRKHSFPLINTILSAHVKYQNAANPQDENGISHLHGACITNHVESLKLFLDNGAPIDQTVNTDSPQDFPGYTPLHFAAEFTSFEAAEILASRGANLNAKNAEGMTPIDICAQQRLDELTNLASDTSRYRGHTNISKNEQVIKLLLDYQGLSNVALSNFQLACTFEDLSIAENLTNQVEDINYVVPLESKIYPGYTAAHFAALNSVDAVKMLAKGGAKFDIEDVGGITPLDICIKKYTIQEIHDILSCVEDWKDIHSSDGKTKLLDLVLSMRDVDQFKLFLQNHAKGTIISHDSLLWSNCTILHLAVLFSQKKSGDWQGPYNEAIIEECLEQGLDVNAKNSRGQTPIHLAYRQDKFNIVELLLKHLDLFDDVENYADNDNLSYLHIACIKDNASLVEKLLRNCEPNVAFTGKISSQIFSNNMSYSLRRIEIVSGTTPLHVAVTRNSHIIAEMLMEHGANLHAPDANGLTPIHWLLWYSGYFGAVPTICNVVLDFLVANPIDCVVDEIKLSYLHVACSFEHFNAIKILLDLGSDVSLAIRNYEKKIWPSFIYQHLKFTPLHCLPRRVEPNVYDLILRHGGVDMFIKFFDAPRYYDNSSRQYGTDEMVIQFMTILLDDEDMQRCIEKRLGLTRLHVACFLKNEEAVRSILTDEIDVNVQVHQDSVIFAGCTPLHLLVKMNEHDRRYQQFGIAAIISMLLDHGADVTIMNAERDTPIHVFHDYRRYFIDGERSTHLLLNGHADFSVNPMDYIGLSHFHIACYCHEVEAVEKFLQRGSVEINKPIELFTGEESYILGFTPLHLALNHEAWSGLPHGDDWTKLIQTLDLLLKYGANVDAEDVHGDTPLHKPAALRSPGTIVFEKLVSHKADVNKENVHGLTPLMKLSNVNRAAYVRFCEKYNCRANSWNRLTGEGYIGKGFLSCYNKVAENPEFEKFLESDDVKTMDEMGSTAIHSAVAVVRPLCEDVDNYLYAVESFQKLDIDIDHRDKSGKTALHYAVRMQNRPGTEALLSCGADIDIVDNDGNSAFTYAMVEIKKSKRWMSPRWGNVVGRLYLHVQKLQHLGIGVSQLNCNFASELQQILDNAREKKPDEDRISLSQNFFSEIELTKTMNVGVNSLTLFDFLTETGAVTLYPYLLVSDRISIDEFFKSVDYKELEELAGIIKQQFKKMKARLELIVPALTALRGLLGFSVAGLCEEITRFLTIYDLKNLIASTECDGEE